MELFRRGHRKILMLMDIIHEPYRQLVEENVQSAYPDRQFSLEMTDFDSESLRTRTENLMEEYIIGKHYTGVITPSVGTAAMVYNWCAKQQLRIPQDLSVLAVESREGEGEQLYPPVSVFCTDTFCKFFLI